MILNDFKITFAPECLDETLIRMLTNLTRLIKRVFTTMHFELPNL